MIETAGFGGGCHWCTEAVFRSLAGVTDVRQGFISADAPHDSYSEAVSVTWENYQDLLKGRFTYVDASDRNVETVQILVEGECAGFASLEQGWLKPKRIIHQQKVL